MTDTTWPPAPGYDDAVDLDRYPINAPAGPAYRALVQACRDQLRSHGVLRLQSSPGTLAVFRGQHALHRVTPVSGPHPRINSVLTYGEHPGMKLAEHTQRLFYGRTA